MDKIAKLMNHGKNIPTWYIFKKYPTLHLPAGERFKKIYKSKTSQMHETMRELRSKMKFPFDFITISFILGFVGVTSILEQ